MSKSAEMHRNGLPYCHPACRPLAASKAARYVADAFLGEENERTIVDAGCGEGRNAIYLVERGFRVIALDASARNLDILRRNPVLASAVPEMFESHVVDLVDEPLPIQERAVDVVLDVWFVGSVVLSHDGRRAAQRYLSEVHRVLKDGGLFIAEFETLRPRRTPEKLLTYFRNLMKGNFAVVESTAITADYVRYLDMGRKRKIPPALFAVARKN